MREGLSGGRDLHSGRLQPVGKHEPSELLTSQTSVHRAEIGHDDVQFLRYVHLRFGHVSLGLFLATVF